MIIYNSRTLSVLTCLSKLLAMYENSQMSDRSKYVVSDLISAYTSSYTCQYNLIKLYEDLPRGLEIPHVITVVKLTA